MRKKKKNLQLIMILVFSNYNKTLISNFRLLRITNLLWNDATWNNKLRKRGTCHHDSLPLCSWVSAVLCDI